MEGLHLSLHQREPIPLDASFDCMPGEVLALVGPSGGGKTTILRAIAGSYRPQHGRISVNDETWYDTDAAVCVPCHRRTVGMVFQNYALFPHMNAAANVMSALRHLTRRERTARATELLSLVNLAGLEDRKPAALSGGQQQRVAVARALARQPRVLLLDEPFSAVDKATRQRLYREIAELRRVLDMPVILVTHDLDEAAMLADRLAVLHRGRVLQIGAPEEVAVKPESAEVARLLDLRNVFDGEVVHHDPDSGYTILDWNGKRLEASHRPHWSPGARVSWVVPEGFVLLHRRDRPSRGEHENPVRGSIEATFVTGQTTHITLRPHHDAMLPVHFTVPSHVARRNKIVTGVEATVSLLAEGIHLMPAQADAHAEGFEAHQPGK